jgi:hypothetical protein
MSEDIRILFQEKFSEHREDPPERVWSEIQNKLDSRSKNTRILRLNRIAAAIIVAFAFYAGYFIGNNEESVQIVKYEPVKIEIPSSNKRTFKDLLAQKKSYINLKSSNTSSKPVVVKYSYSSSLKDMRSRMSMEDKELFEAYVLEKKRKEIQKRIGIVNKATPKLAYIESNNIHNEFNLKNYTKQETTNIEEDEFYKYFHNEKQELNKWGLGLSIGGGYSRGEDNTPQIDSENKTNYTSNISNVNSINGGINLSYKVNNFIKVSGGIRYAKMGQSQTNSYEVMPQSTYKAQGYSMEEKLMNRGFKVREFSTNVGNVRKEMHQTADVYNSLEADVKSQINISEKITQRMDFVEVPVNVDFTLFDSFIKLSLRTGGSLNMLVNNNAEIDYNEDTYIAETKNLKQYSFAGNLGLGIHYPITKHIWLNINPNIKYFFDSINEKIDYKPFDYTLQTGLSFILP